MTSLIGNSEQNSDSPQSHITCAPLALGTETGATDTSPGAAEHGHYRMPIIEVVNISSSDSESDDDTYIDVEMVSDDEKTMP